MTGSVANLALAGLTVLVGALLVSAFSLGVAGARSPEGVLFAVVVLAVLGPILVEPFRLVAAGSDE